PGRVAANRAIGDRRRCSATVAVVVDAAASALIGQISSDCAAVQRQGCVIVVDAGAKTVGGWSGPVDNTQTGDGDRFAGADVKHAPGVPGSPTQVGGVTVGWNPPDGDAFVYDQLAEPRGQGEVPPAYQGIELDRVAVVCFCQRLAQVRQTKTISYF